MDILCAKCGEPWDSYCGHDGTMTVQEWADLKRGKGCPACHFGTICVSCEGTGKRVDFADACAVCRGSRKVTVRRSLVPPSAVWEYDYIPNVRIVPDTVVVPQEGRNVFACLGPKGPGSGMAVENRIPCWACLTTAPACDECGGDGKNHRKSRTEFYQAIDDIMGNDEDGVISALEDLDAFLGET